MFLRMTSSVLALAAMSAPVFADVTPEQVWQSWVEYYQSVGYTVTDGGQNKAGSTLTLKDVSIAGGAEGTSVKLKLPQVVLSDEGGGKVKTVFADTVTTDVSGTDADGVAFDVPLTIAMPGNSMITSGAPEDMTHSFDYPTLDVSLATVTTGGEQKPMPIKISIADTTGSYHFVAGSPDKYDYDMKSGAVTFEGNIADENEGHATFSGAIDGFETTGTMAAISAMADAEQDINAALKAGLAMDGSLKVGPLSAVFDFSGKDADDQPQNNSGKMSGKGFTGTFGMSKDGMSYKSAAEGVSAEMTTSDVPFPITYAIENAGFDLLMPLMQADDPQPFKLSYNLTGLTIGDQIWAMFDPEAKLPRDPASIEVDLSGLAHVQDDLLDPATLAAADDAGADDSAMDGEDTTAPADDTDSATADGVAPDAAADDAEAMADADAMADEPTPFMPVEVAINKFALSLLGAKVNATGELKAPEDGDIGTPLGAVHAEMEGVNALIDKLVAMGALPQDQLMGVRMMLGLFTKPVDGDANKLTTDLEFKEGGAIFANGQQIK